jgi:integrase/recombinase XerD
MPLRGQRKATPDSKFSLPVDRWPATDQLFWAKAMKKGDAFETSGPAASWAPATLRSVEYGYGQWLKWLADNYPADLRLQPCDRVTRGRAKAYVESLSKRVAPATVQISLQRLGQTMAAFSGTADFSWIFNAANRMRPISVRNKKLRVQPAYALAELGLRLMNEASALSPDVGLKGATKFRTGLLIAFLSYRPIRRRNLSSISLGTHLLEIDGGYIVKFSADETKQHVELQFEWPHVLVPHLQRYLTEFRPYLVANGQHGALAGQYLWIAKDGGPITPQGIERLISVATKAAFGTPINPHLFRDCAATTIAVDDPVNAYAIAGVLGHSSMVTSEKHYNQAQMMDAAQQFHDVLQSYRRRRGSKAA